MFLWHNPPLSQNFKLQIVQLYNCLKWKRVRYTSNVQYFTTYTYLSWIHEKYMIFYPDKAKKEFGRWAEK